MKNIGVEYLKGQNTINEHKCNQYNSFEYNNLNRFDNTMYIRHDHAQLQNVSRVIITTTFFIHAKTVQAKLFPVEMYHRHFFHNFLSITINHNKVF